MLQIVMTNAKRPPVVPQASKVLRGHWFGNMPLPNLTTIKVSTRDRAMPSQANGPSLLNTSFWPVSINMYLQDHHHSHQLACRLQIVHMCFWVPAVINR